MFKCQNSACGRQTQAGEKQWPMTVATRPKTYTEPVLNADGTPKKDEQGRVQHEIVGQGTEIVKQIMCCQECHPDAYFAPHRIVQ